MHKCKFCSVQIRETDITRLCKGSPVCEACARMLDNGAILKLFLK